MSRRARFGLASLLSTLLLVAGCSAPGPAPTAESSTSAPELPSAAPGSPVSSSTPPRPSATPSAGPSSPAATPRAEPAKPHPVSVRALIEREYDGRGLKLGRLITDAGAYRRYLVSYRSEGLRISGVMNVPDARGPFPVLVLAHGYIDPDIYQPGQGMRREQDYLARQGYVVLHTDYRGHASSDDDSSVDYELRLPYAVDVVNAVLAVKSSKLAFLDGDRVGLFGRSMGGNVVLNALVAKPGLVDAAVIYASTSSLAAENWDTFSRRSPDRARVNRQIADTYGLPDDSPEFWRAASPRTYFRRVSEPVQLHHGTADDTCPPRWSASIVKDLRAAGKDAKLYRYPGEGHTFYAGWRRSIQRTDAFFARHLT